MQTLDGYVNRFVIRALTALPQQVASRGMGSLCLHLESVLVWLLNLYLKTKMHVGEYGLNRGELNFGRRKWIVITCCFLFSFTFKYCPNSSFQD